jgi:hypothetical protein
MYILSCTSKKDTSCFDWFLRGGYSGIFGFGFFFLSVWDTKKGVGTKKFWWLLSYIFCCKAVVVVVRCVYIIKGFCSKL